MGQVACIVKKYTQHLGGENLKEINWYRRPRRRCEHNIKMDLTERSCRINLA